jgi:hypothetical protein
MSRLEHVLQVGVQLKDRSAWSPPEPTKGLFWTSKNEKLAREYVKHYWWYLLAYESGETFEQSKQSDHMATEYFKMKRAIQEKGEVFVNAFPARSDVRDVTKELVKERWRVPPKGEYNPNELKFVADDLWAEIKKHVRGAPSRFDGV